MTDTDRPSVNPADELAAFVADLSYDDLPATAVHTAERCFVDTTGVALAGSVDGPAAIAADTFERPTNSPESATLFGRETRASPADAAFVNGTAGHYLDFDDVVTAIHIHPSVTLVPAILAVGEVREASGMDAITAFVAGVEAQHYVAAPINPTHYERGWHATATYGTFGATTAVASLLELDEGEIRHALNVAGSLPSGVKRNFGSMAKSMHAGEAARSGVTAALLAERGFSGSMDALVGEDGFFDLYCGTKAPDYDALYELGTELRLERHGIDVKKFPCCYFTHSPIEAATTLSREHDVDPAAVDRIHVAASQAARDTVTYGAPESGLEGKFSMPYTVASAVARDRVGIETFTEEAIYDEPVRSLLGAVVFEVDRDLPYSSHAATVRIELDDGTDLETHRTGPPGTVEDSLSDAELREKFTMCAKQVLDEGTTRETFSTLDELRTVEDVSAVFGPL